MKIGSQISWIRQSTSIGSTTALRICQKNIARMRINWLDDNHKCFPSLDTSWGRDETESRSAIYFPSTLRRTPKYFISIQAPTDKFVIHIILMISISTMVTLKILILMKTTLMIKIWWCFFQFKTLGDMPELWYHQRWAHWFEQLNNFLFHSESEIFSSNSVNRQKVC